MRTIRPILCFAIVLMITARLFAQAGATGTILGTVTDSSGAILPAVKVTVTNTQTNVAFRTVTSSAGDYNAPALNPGTYTVSAEAAGFQKSVTTSFVLAVDQKVRIDLALKPGTVSETLEVTAQAVELDTDSASLSQLVSQKQVEELPLDGRNFVQLLFLGAGAVTIGGEQGTMRQGKGNAISVNGGRPEGNNFTLDGLVNTDSAMETPAVILSQDAIGEFKVQSGIYPAEYGFSAAQVNVVSKGGTNQIHGTVFESDRNNAFQALPFPTATNYIASTKTTNPVLKLNQFGFVASGPVLLPKVYNGRNRTFWMVDYEGWRMDNGEVLGSTWPNPGVLSGDFSQETYPSNLGTVNGVALPGGLLPAYGTPECTALLTLSYNCMPVNPLTGQAYPNNMVPSSAFTSRIGLVGVANGFFGAPTVANQPEGVTNSIVNIPGPLTMNQQTYRGDQTLGKFGSVFGRFTHSNYVNTTNYNSNSAVLGLESYFETEKAFAISHTINVGSKSVNNFRFGYLSAAAPQGNSTSPPDSVVSALGLQGVFTKFAPLQSSWPNIGMTTYSTGGGPGNAYTGSTSPEWEYADSFTSVHGKHTLGFGVDYRHWTLTRNLDDDFLGTWGYSSNLINSNSVPISTTNSASSCPNAPVSVNGGAPAPLCGTGNAVADMMLGYYSGTSEFVPGPLSPTTFAGNPQTHVFNYFAPYAEDDWKLTPKLSINYGLRWDFRAATYEEHNHFFWLDTQNAAGGLCYADPQLTTDGVAPGVGINGGPILRYCGKVPRPGLKNPFAPRIGVNYRITDNTVVRGGYGMFYSSYEGREIDDSADIYPYSERNNWNPTTQNSLDQYKLSNGLFPSNTTLGPFPESTLSFIAVIESENPLDPYVQSWTLSVERELARNTTLELNYVGTKGTHLLDRHNIAQQLDIPAGSLAFCQQQDASGVYYNAVGSTAVAPCSIASRLPYTNFNGTYIDSDFHGFSNYNAANVKFEHRAGDLAATAVFTYAKSMDDKSATAGAGGSLTGYEGFEDNSRPYLDYGRSDFNVPLRFVSSYIYDLPVGRGKKFANNINRAEDIVVGGWELSGITTFQKGFPYSVSANDIDSITGSGGMRANLTPGCNIHQNNYTGVLAKFDRLNIGCFTGPPLGTYGGTGRNIYNQPGINNFDIGIGKSFQLYERMRFVFKVDAFNAFNHHQYAGDVGGLLVAGSGGNQVISSGVGSSTGGLITGSSSARIFQFAGKIQF
jgi:Carboxypeptidase regulatory-like domain/TonB dependent receptor